jgi:hypothetical protein
MDVFKCMEYPMSVGQASEIVFAKQDRHTRVR